MGRWVAALCGVIAILLTACSTIVKGTRQQVSIAMPGVQDAVCTLSSPAVGTRTVQTPGTIILPKSKHDRRGQLRQATLHYRVWHARLRERDYDCRQCHIRRRYWSWHRRRIRCYEQISTRRRNRHEPDPKLRRPTKGTWRADGKNSGAPARSAELSPNIELPIPRLLG
jgi:hypothetical protein